MGVWKNLLRLRLEFKIYAMVPSSRRSIDNEIGELTMQNNFFKIFITSILLSTGIQRGHSQGTFRNLDFESAMVPVNPNGVFELPIANALPAWTAYIGGSPVDLVLYDTRNLDAAGISLQDSTSPVFQPLQGNYSVFLQGSSIFAPTASAAIGQIGRIAPGTRSVILYATPGSSLQVTFGSHLIPLVQIGSAANYNILGGDISGYAGVSDELRLTVLPNTGALLDNVQFSMTPVPEPSEIALAVMGALLLGLRRRRT